MNKKEPLATLGRYSTRPSGDGFEIMDDQTVVAWTLDGSRALFLLSLLVKADAEGPKE